MSNNMNINFISNASKMSNTLESLGKSMENLGKAGRKAGGDFRSFQKETRKINDAFSNMARDGNRTTRVFKGMTLGSLKLSNILGMLLSHRVGAWLRQGITSAMDMIETNELFRVSLGELTAETDNTVRALSNLTGMDVANLRDRVANFNLLAKTMGMTSKNSQTLGLNMNQLAMDMGAVFNVSYAQVAEDLRSGLVGQSRVLYKYGIDVTNAQLAEEARARGIQKSVNKMTQAEKMMLRYSVILKQTTAIQGEFAHEFNFPMNQLRIFQERFVTLTRTIGQLFLPVFGSIIKVANGVVIALTRVANAIARIFGIDVAGALDARDMGDGFAPLDDELESTEDGIGGVTKKAKELKKQLAGFDELNIIQTKAPETPSGGLGDGGLDDGLDFDLTSYDALLDKITDSATEMADKITDAFKKIWDVAEPTREAIAKLWNEGLSKFADFSMGTLMDFYNSFLVPVGQWNLGENGLGRFFNIINDILNEIDWDRLRNSLDGFFKELGKANIEVGKAVLDFMENVLKPIAVWTMGVGLPTFIDTITRFLSDIDWDKIHSSLNGLWEAIAPFAINVGEGLLWFLDNVLRPIATFTINEVVPRFLDLLSNLINILNGTIEALKPLGSWLMDNFLKPLGEWTGEKIIQGLDWLNNGLKTFSDWIENNQKIVEGLAIFIGSLAGAIGLVTVATKLWTAISWLASYGTTALGVALLSVNLPLVAVVAGIAGVIAIGVLLYKNWDTIKDYAGKLWEGIKKSFDDIGKKVKEVWDNVKKWGVETWKKIIDTFKNVGTWFSDRFKEAWDNIVKAFSTVKKWSGDRWKDITDVFKVVGTWFSDKFKEGWKSIVDAFKGIASWAIDRWNDVTNGFKNVASWFGDMFSDAWKNLISPFSGAKEWASGVWGDIKSGFKDVANWFGDKFRDAGNNIDRELSGRGGSGTYSTSGRSSYSTFSTPNIPMLAKGGVLDMGQMFIAREAGAELVGNFGGRTAVMNNDDIIYSVTKGVYQAVKMAMSGMGGGGEPIQIEINILGDTVMDKIIPAIKRENRKNNKLVIDVD